MTPTANKTTSRTIIKILFVFGFLIFFILATSEYFLFQKYSREGINFTIDESRFIQLREHVPNRVDRLEIKVDGETREIVKRSDSFGFTGPLNRHEEPDFKLVFLGDSVTDGGNVREKRRFSYLSGKILEKKTGFKINSYNAAYPATNLIHSTIILLGKIIPLKPHAIIILHNASDVGALVAKNGYWGEKLSSGKLIQKFSDRLGDEAPTNKFQFFVAIKNATLPITWNFLRKKLVEVKETVADLRPAPLTQDTSDKAHVFESEMVQYSKALLSIYDVARRHGIKAIFLTQPTRGDDELPVNQRDFMLVRKYSGATYKFNEVVREIGRDENIMVIDLAYEFSKMNNRTSLFYDFVHLNEEGHKKVAEIIGKKYAKILKK